RRRAAPPRGGPDGVDGRRHRILRGTNVGRWGEMRFAFEDCVFDSDTREVFRGGKPLALSPKAMELLELLVSERPKALSKERIHARLWPKTFVSDASLSNLVAELRSALGDDARTARIIRPVQRFGYAFVSE